MVCLNEIDWGPTDADAPDRLFTEKFVEPIEVKQLLHPKYCIVTGEKGSGKTALRQALLQKYKGNYSGIVDMDFNALEYPAIVLNLNQLAQVTNIPRLSMLTHYWQYVLLVQCMKEFLLRVDDGTHLDYSLVRNYLEKNHLIEASYLRMFLNLITKCWSFVDSYTRPSEHKGFPDMPFLPSNLAPEVVDQIKDFPMLNPEFVTACSSFDKCLKAHKQHYLIILDGFDRFENREAIRSDVNLIFESLVEAVYALSISPTWSTQLEIKALIPHDRFLNIRLRDSDKFGERQRSIKWTYVGLQEMLARRARLHSKLSQISEFDKIWRELLPERIENPYYHIEEYSYDYLLRHTMHRPRQLQMHLQMLGEHYQDQVIEPHMLARIVKQSCRKIAKYYIDEYYIDHPRLDMFIARFHDKFNILAFQEFRSIVEDAISRYSIQGWTVEAKIDTLYEMGFFGVLHEIAEHHLLNDDECRYLPPRKAGIKPYRVMFYYKNPRSRIVNRLNDRSRIAIHPMFFDYADMKPDPDLIVG